MKIRKYLDMIVRYAKKLLPLMLCVLLLILILKQLHLYSRVVGIYTSCFPVLMGFLVAFFFQPVIDRLKKHFSTRVSVIIVYLGIFIVGTLFIIVLIPLLYKQIIDFIEVVPEWVTKIEMFMKKYHIVYEDIGGLKEKYVQEGYRIVVDSVRSTMSMFTKFGIAYITAFFISIDLDFWKRTMKKLVPNIQRVSTFYFTMSNIVYQYLVGTIIDLLFIVISVGTVLCIFDFPNAILYAIILALMNLFPYVGSSLGLVVIAIVSALSYKHFPVVLFAIVWSIQQIEANFIQPMIFNRTMHVRPILTFVFIFIAEGLFGVIGVILSPIFAAIAQIGFRSYLHSKTSTKVGEWEEIWQDFDEVMKTQNY